MRSFTEEIPFVTCIANISRSWESFRLSSTAAFTKSLERFGLKKKKKNKRNGHRISLLQSKQPILLRTFDVKQKKGPLEKYADFGNGNSKKITENIC